MGLIRKIILHRDSSRSTMRMAFKFSWNGLSVEESNMKSLQNLNEGGAAIQGYDPVSYFQGNPVKGDENISSKHEGASYFFTNTSNKALFDAAPEKYVPQYGGFCAIAISEGKTFPIDPNTYVIADDKLYLFYNGSLGNTKTQWEEDPVTRQANADNHWKDSDITVVYPSVAY